MKQDKIYISKIITNNNQEITFNYNDIVVFVGPNNAGKSQCLKDIYNLSSFQTKGNTVVIKSIEKINDGINASEYLMKYGKSLDGTRHPKNFYQVLNKNIYDGKNITQKNNYGTYRDLFIANLTTEERLTIVRPVENIDDNYYFNHPILYAGYNSSCRKWLSDNFHKAFGEDLIPNIHAGKMVPLCIGDTPNFSGETFENEIERQEKLIDILKNYKKVHQQGDGIKSFVGVLLYLMLPFFKTYLIDEPESFLHQPQATMMGRIIAESTNDKQCFITTHSEHLLNGLLDVAPNRVKIIRITRDGDTNYFSCLDNLKLYDIWKNPILKHSNIVSGMFYNNVVICESDSDCKMYSSINDFLKNKESKYSESLFVHCGGKYRIADASTALKSLNVDIRIIADIDLLNSKETLKNIVSSVGGDFTSLSKDFDILTNALSSKGNPKTKSEILEEIKRIIERSDDKYMSNEEIQHVKTILKPNSSWTNFKENGVSSVPRGDVAISVKSLLNELKKYNIFLVPLGELESFVKEVGGHGPHWVNEVLDQYPDFDNPIYEKIKEFVLSLNI